MTEPQQQAPEDAADMVDSVAQDAADVVVEGELEAEAPSVEQLRTALAAAEDELAERVKDLQLLQAQYANYRRRVERDKVAEKEAAKAALAGELVAVLDDLDRARAHGDLDASPLRAVADKLSAVLAGQGLVGFGAEGDVFDPSLHEAVSNEATGHDLVIGSVYRKGYTFGERVLRTAMVAVADRPAPAGEQP